MDKTALISNERKDALILKQAQILNDYVCKIPCMDNKYGLWGQYISAIDFIEDSCYAIQQFYDLPNIERPVLLYIGIIATLTIQLNAVQQLHDFFFSRIDNEKLINNQLQIPNHISQIRDVRNYLHHASRQTIPGSKEKDNYAYVFIAKNRSQDKFSFEYCWATSQKQRN